jgi:hypothetical protein
VASTGGRPSRTFAKATAFWAGAVAAAVPTYGVIGSILPLQLRDRARTPLGAVILLYGLVWHLGSRHSFPFARDGIQANRRLAACGIRGLVYFGGLLGVGLLTTMTTPLVLAGGVLTALSGPLWGAAYGAGFATGRAAPAFAATALNRGPARLTPGDLAQMFTVRGAKMSRSLGGVVALVTLICFMAGSV